MRINKVLFVAVLFIFGVSTAAFSTQVQIWGSTTCQKRFLEPGAKALKDETGVEVKVVGVGTGKGLIGLIQGKAPASAASNELEDAVKSAQKTAKKSGKKIVIPDNLVFHEIARDIIVPIVHKDNPVSSLTWEQLKDIHTGKTKNWKDVGGSDVPIRVITSHAGSATKAVFQKMVMKKADYVSNAVKVKSTRNEINEVSKYKGAIGAVSEGFFKLNPGKTKIVKADKIARPLALITMGNPTPEVQKVLDFFGSEKGKKYIQ
jgi:phosphate transport system substrate-binding protein